MISSEKLHKPFLPLNEIVGTGSVPPPPRRWVPHTSTQRHLLLRGQVQAYVAPCVMFRCFDAAPSLIHTVPH